MGHSSNSSHASTTHEITPLNKKVGWTFIKKEKHSVIASNNWCIPLPLLPSPKTEMATTLIHLISQFGTLMQQWQLESLIQQFSYTSQNINRMIETENGKVQNLTISDDVKVRAEKKICRSLLYMVQFPAIKTSAKHVLMEDYKARWMIEYSGTMTVDHGEYLHSILLKGGILASGSNMMEAIEEEQIQRIVANQRANVILPEGMKHSNYPMKFLLWNCIDASRADFRANFLDLVATHKPNVVALTETRISSERSREQCASLGFDRCYVADPIEFGGGLWLMWDSSEVEVDLIILFQKEIHAAVQATMEL